MRFHLIFWLLAGLALFISGWSQSNAFVSLIRNTYLVVMGASLSFLVIKTWTKLGSAKARKSWVLFLGICYLLGILIVPPINPVTFALLGIGFEDFTSRHLFAGVMNFGFVCILWGIAFIFLFETGFKFRGNLQSPFLKPSKAKPAPGLEAEHSGQTTVVPLSEINYIKGAADYVEVHLFNDKIFLKRSTLKSLLNMLEPQGFVQVHRSLLINRNSLSGVEGRSKGSYTIIMNSGARLQTSRRFKPAVEALLAEVGINTP